MKLKEKIYNIQGHGTVKMLKKKKWFQFWKKDEWINLGTCKDITVTEYEKAPPK